MNLSTLPQISSEWKKQLSRYVRQNGDVVNTQHLYQLFAVDGFAGVNHLKLYLNNIIDNLPSYQRRYVSAIRKMYQWMMTQNKLSDLTGSDSAVVVFLALLKLFENRVNIFDQMVKFILHRARLNADALLHKNANYYQDVRRIDENLLDELGRVFETEYDDLEELQFVAVNKLNNLSCISAPKKTATIAKKDVCKKKKNNIPKKRK
jgi:hypothetical protein